ncbi:predicted protein [Sclerotinia sclerotiorum 1980 UF-70]|uniref:Uncharacterized protein n=1 Tax=Sclerotinia sclerotiorum (strain ATCC 18683 / 1980 / Ss-1) TaxID=665079 RepID=A7E9G0_SCLS1|nr:predicted protein [Sclerotinia sclerotiorum 1980 UF-70]EDN97012.1 predicted protein [Sclerotinia sclerotiorum 1980 UF-70]
MLLECLLQHCKCFDSVPLANNLTWNLKGRKPRRSTARSRRSHKLYNTKDRIDESGCKK